MFNPTLADGNNTGMAFSLTLAASTHICLFWIFFFIGQTDFDRQRQIWSDTDARLRADSNLRTVFMGKYQWPA